MFWSKGKAEAEADEKRLLVTAAHFDLFAGTLIRSFEGAMREVESKLAEALRARDTYKASSEQWHHDCIELRRQLDEARAALEANRAKE